ncbi:MAG: UDP-N-acetylmuramoyl-L-alanine--D-glutamate ligase [bacterium]|nr:UDP-N-acetylmuramoyl-L-alanine--D-glutamate ligase [bacterium]
MRVLIVGKGKSGVGAYNLLVSLGHIAFMVDDEVFNKKGNLLNGLSFLVLSPGVSLNSPWVKAVQERKIKVISELELGSMFLKSQYYAITGTNGKTTITRLLGEMMKTRKKTWVGGNIGVSLSSFALRVKSQDAVIIEVSSFMLESIDKFKPKIAAITNITPDHLNRHKTMQNYINLKFKIFKNLTRYDYAVLNADDDIIMAKSKSLKQNKYYFSTKKEVRGCFIKNGNIYFKDDFKLICISRANEILLIGEHNKSNVLCALLMFILSGGNPKSVLSVIKNFKLDPHRIERVGEFCGVSFIDDSKATNIASTLASVKCFASPIILLVGGSDKQSDFSLLFNNLPKNVKHIIMFGEVRNKLASALNLTKFNSFSLTKTLKEAIGDAIKLMVSKDVVLLSPACASFDEFSSYAERGRFFEKVVKEKLVEKQTPKTFQTIKT